MTGILQIQHDRIKALIEADSELGTKVLQYPPAQIDNVLPVILPLVSRQTVTSVDSSAQTLQTDWTLNLYLQLAGTSLELVNRVNTYEYLDRLIQLFWANRSLQVNNVGLSYTSGSEFSLLSGLDRPLRYPIQSSGGQLYWGAQFRLTIYSQNYPLCP